MARKKQQDDEADVNPVPGDQGEDKPTLDELSPEQQEMNRLHGSNQTETALGEGDTESIKNSPLFGSNQGDVTGGDTPQGLANEGKAVFRVVTNNLFLAGKKRKTGEEVALTPEEAAEARHHVVKK